MTGMGRVVILLLLLIPNWEQRDKVLQEDPAVLLMVAKELLLEDETLPKLLPADPAN